MSHCTAVKANYTECTAKRLTNQLVCGIHRNMIAEDAAKESSRNADNTSALAKASDKTTNMYAMMIISDTPGTKKDHMDAKNAEDKLKQRILNDNENHKKDTMMRKCTEAAGVAIHYQLATILPPTTICSAIEHIGTNSCPNPATSADSICDAHRATLARTAAWTGLSLITPIPTTLPIKFATTRMNTNLDIAFREGVNAARIVRFSTTVPPPAPLPPVVAAPVPARRVAVPPLLTAPIDIAPHIAKQHLEMSLALGKPLTCPICYDPVDAETILMTHCGHIYCKTCITQSRERERKCPQCRVVI